MRAEYPFRNAIASLMLTPLFGIPSGVYRLHHRVMHHVVSARSDLSRITAPTMQKSWHACAISATFACVCCSEACELAWRELAASNNIIPAQQGRAAALVFACCLPISGHVAANQQTSLRCATGLHSWG